MANAIVILLQNFTCSLLLPFWKDEPVFQVLIALPICQGQTFRTAR